MKLKVDGVEYDYYSFRLYMSYYMTDDGLRMLYAVLGRRKGEYGKVEEDCIKSFSTPEEAAMYHFELQEQLNAENQALLEQVDRVLEKNDEDMETIPFAPNPRVESIVKAVEEMLFPEVMEEETYADTEICSSS